MRRILSLVAFAMHLGTTSYVCANPPVLANPSRVGDDFQFTLIGQSNAVYVIEVSTDLVAWFPFATNNDASASRIITLRTFVDQFFCRVVGTGRILLDTALAVQDAIDLNGNNLFVDSFDSQDPAYSNQGSYFPPRARDGGEVAAFLGLTDSLSAGNVTIKGLLRTGPAPTLALGPLGTVGSAAWVASGQGGIEPGHHSTDMIRCFPEVQPPFESALPATSGPYPPLVGTNYTFLLGTGNYMNSFVSMSGPKRALVLGNAVWWVTDGVSMSALSQINIAPNASLRLYVGRLTGSNTTAVLGGNGLVNESGNATNLFFYGLPSLVSLSQSGGAAFVGVIYAPNAEFTMNGAGNSAFDFVGACVARAARMNAAYNFHFDENLKRLGAVP